MNHSDSDVDEDSVVDIYSVFILKRQLKEACELIEKLQEEKAALKAALKTTMKKKEKLFKEATQLYHLVRENQGKSPELCNQLENNQELLRTLKEGILKRDQLINELRQRPKSEAFPSEIAEAVNTVISLAHSDKTTYKTLKKHIGCTATFKQTLRTQTLPSISLKILAFLTELLSSPHGKPLKKPYSVFGDLPVQINRVARLNQEMVDTMARSKQLLSSPQYNRQHVPSLRVPKTQEFLDAKLDMAESKISFDSPNSENLLVDSFLIQPIKKEVARDFLDSGR